MYEPSRKITDFHIRGFQHWDGALKLESMKAGMKVDLVAEPDNPHDPSAMAIYFDKAKLGYMPAESNELYAALAYFGHSAIFEARILQVNSELDPWKQVRVGIYVVDARA